MLCVLYNVPGSRESKRGGHAGIPLRFDQRDAYRTFFFNSSICLMVGLCHQVRTICCRQLAKAGVLLLIPVIVSRYKEGIPFVTAGAADASAAGFVVPRRRNGYWLS